MDNELIMSILTGLLVFVGLAQVLILIHQKRQNQLVLLQEYRNRWNEYQRQWAITIFIGRTDDDYYQVAAKNLHLELMGLVEEYSLREPTTWALEAIRCVSNTLSDICTRILQGQLEISDVYPLFGSELLRHSRPLRILLDVYYPKEHAPYEDHSHKNIRRELQDWLIYHDGIRRRCLILIDLLWAEAARLEDLAPSDIGDAANAKIYSGKQSRKRLINEIQKINNAPSLFRVIKLTLHLKNSEFKKYKWQVGIRRSELEEREKKWTDMLTRK
ncbi:hypothetical protein [Photobacterium damselae]|uniref:hypothetical protein n=1 Tax=Photobacterium damselae TaxID=38293 RepID=UPI001F2DD0E3|nr:hypothetical protein [Photobacterium damselae]UKA11691.1 hypothetical protein IHC91_18070 [Photobacterium damselae subsp. damselae]